MKEKILYCIWACLFILCVGLGFIPEPVGFGKAVLVMISVLFFVPGGMILIDGIRANDRKAVLRIRWICIGSLSLTVGFLIANFCSVGASDAVGNTLYELLIIVSSPMICSQYWALSLFLWSCLLTGSFLLPKKP